MADLEPLTSLDQITSSTDVLTVARPKSGTTAKAVPLAGTLAPVYVDCPTLVVEPSEIYRGRWIDFGSRERPAGQGALAAAYGDRLMVTVQGQGVQLYKVGHATTIQAWTTAPSTTFARPAKLVTYAAVGPRETAELTVSEQANTGLVAIRHRAYAIIQTRQDLPIDHAARLVWTWDASTGDIPSNQADLPRFEDRLERLLPHPVHSLDTSSQLAGRVAVVHRTGAVALYDPSLGERLAEHPHSGPDSCVLWSHLVGDTAAHRTFWGTEASADTVDALLVLTQTLTQNTAATATLTYYTLTRDPYQIVLVGAAEIPLADPADMSLAALPVTPAPLGVVFTPASATLHILTAQGTWVRLAIARAASGHLRVTPASPVSLNHLATGQALHTDPLEGPVRGVLPPSLPWDHQNLAALPKGYLGIVGGSPRNPTEPANPLACTLTLWDPLHRSLHAERTFTVPSVPTAATEAASLTYLRQPLVQCVSLPGANQIVVAVTTATAYTGAASKKASPRLQAGDFPLCLTDPVQPAARLTWSTQLYLGTFLLRRPTLLTTARLHERTLAYTAAPAPVGTVADSDTTATKNKRTTRAKAKAKSDLPTLDVLAADTYLTHDPAFAVVKTMLPGPAHEFWVGVLAVPVDLALYLPQLLAYVFHPARLETAEACDHFFATPFLGPNRCPQSLPATLDPGATQFGIYHLLAQGLTRRTRATLALCLGESAGASPTSYLKGSPALHRVQFPAYDFTPPVPAPGSIPPRLLLAILSRLFGVALDPAFKEPLARCLEAGAANPRPLQSLAYATSIDAVADLPEPPVECAIPANDYWPRASVAVLIRAALITSSVLRHGLLPYLVARGDWDLVRLALSNVADFPDTQIVWALRSYLRHLGRTHSTTAAQVPRLLEHSDVLLTLTLFLSYPRTDGLIRRAYRRLFNAEDVTVWGLLLDDMWTLREQTASFFGVWFDHEAIVDGRLPALADLAATLTNLLDGHMMTFVTTVDLHPVVQRAYRATSVLHELKHRIDRSVGPYRPLLLRKDENQSPSQDETTPPTALESTHRFLAQLPVAYLQLFPEDSDAAQLPALVRSLRDIPLAPVPSAVRIYLTAVLGFPVTPTGPSPHPHLPAPGHGASLRADAADGTYHLTVPETRLAQLLEYLGTMLRTSALPQQRYAYVFNSMHVFDYLHDPNFIEQFGNLVIRIDGETPEEARLRRDEPVPYFTRNPLNSYITSLRITE
ncbi:hypothetical protein IWQ60_009799 [Tieghemiomyces parasiticus]|uniref:Uncharacterized protein n=1 Tax=Tieghemiomyces parasiticus TaxID=78921 RepID=A0A9W8DJB5_9FUNG|nr:hypothetical protein IWQ60_009799 [Tieghemiomyces parasiticus]